MQLYILRSRKSSLSAPLAQLVERDTSSIYAAMSRSPVRLCQGANLLSTSIFCVFSHLIDGCCLSTKHLTFGLALYDQEHRDFICVENTITRFHERTRFETQATVAFVTRSFNRLSLTHYTSFLTIVANQVGKHVRRSW